MKKNNSIKIALVIGIITLFIITTVTPNTFGYKVRISNNEMIIENNVYDCYDASEIPNYIEHHTYGVSPNYESLEPGEVSNMEMASKLLDGPMDSPWPMYCHDTRHTGRSPFSTINVLGTERWWFKSEDGYVEGSAVIDDDGTIYFGSWDRNFYALYSNGTMKWSYFTNGCVQSSPAVDENGIIYIGTFFGDLGLYAFYQNGTLKWKHNTGQIYSSPAIGDDGTIYFGDANNNINALYPNGTLKWRYKTNHVVYSSPAIGNDGTVYCGSHDTYLYALYPNNGTLKWKYKTGHWIRTSPCIGDDGTIYVVSLDNYLHAVNPDGSNKWSTNVGAGTSPTIGQDGTIYAGYRTLHAIDPVDGSVKWTFDVGGTMRGGTPCNSIDGTIYFGTNIGEYNGGEIIAVNPDGTERWRKIIATEWVEFAPVIGEDGTVYIGSSSKEEIGGGYVSVGYLHAFGKLDSDAPSAPTITGETNGKVDAEYDYTFKSTSPLGRDIYYYIEWGDGTTKDWFGPYSSGEKITVNHTYSNQGTYTIKARAKDTDNLWGPWGELKVTMPKNRQANNWWFLRFLESRPRMFPILRNLLGLT